MPQRVAAWTLAALLALALVVELLRRRSRAVATRFSALFAPLLRAHETRALTGATWLLLAMTLAVAVLPLAAAIAATWAAAAGDTMAALVGMRWGRHRAANGKSLEGSAACALATAVGAATLAQLPLAAATVCGVVAAIAEWLPWPDDDNIRIATLVGAAAWAWGMMPY